jgi:hypothetical protein
LVLEVLEVTPPEIILVEVVAPEDFMKLQQ